MYIHRIKFLTLIPSTMEFLPYPYYTKDRIGQKPQENPMVLCLTSCDCINRKEEWDYVARGQEKIWGETGGNNGIAYGLDACNETNKRNK